MDFVLNTLSLRLVKNIPVMWACRERTSEGHQKRNEGVEERNLSSEKGPVGGKGAGGKKSENVRAYLRAWKTMPV